MRNHMASTQSNPSFDYIEVGCIIDGSHSHPDDFSVAIIRYAEKLGWKIGDQDLVHVLIRELGLKMSDEYFADYGHYLAIASDEAVGWLNDHVTDETHHFEVIESDLFLEKTYNPDEDDNPLDNLPGHQGYHPF